MSGAQLYELGNGICGYCGADLLGSEIPKAGEIYECSRPGCGNKAPYEDVVAECGAWYKDWLQYGEQNGRPGLSLQSLYGNWRPRCQYRFRVQLIGQQVVL